MNEQDMITLTPRQAMMAIRCCIRANQPVCLWGTPGISKSNLYAQVSREDGIGLIDTRVSLLDPVDLRGMPSVSNGATRWNAPCFLPEDGEGVFLIDEINRGTPMIQNAMLQLVLDRKLGEYSLPGGWLPCAAANFESNGGGIQRMPSALAERFTHINVEPVIEDWVEWANIAGVHPLVVAFLKQNPHRLNCYDSKQRCNPNPRNWAAVGAIYAANPEPEIEQALIAGRVGQGAAFEIMGFARLFRQMISIPSILASPDTAPVPTESSLLFSVASALARYATIANFGAVTRYAARMGPDFEVSCVIDAVRRDKGLKETPAWTRWTLDHPEVCNVLA